MCVCVCDICGYSSRCKSKWTLVCYVKGVFVNEILLSLTLCLTAECLHTYCIIFAKGAAGNCEALTEQN